MSIAFNHTIVPAKDKWASARFLAGILALEAGPQWAQFVPIRTSNGVTLDFMDSDHFQSHHYAFLLSDTEFDAALSRLQKVSIATFADFDGAGPNQINHLYGGRGVYFYDPNGHLMELITRPYGSRPERWRDPRSGGSD